MRLFENTDADRPSRFRALLSACAAWPDRPPHAGCAPGPAEIPLLGSAIPLRRDPLGFLTRSAARYGRVFRFRLGTLEVHIVGDAASAKHVLQENQRNYRKAFGYDKVRPVLGNGLLTSEGEPWRRQRRLMQPTFHPQRIGRFAGIVQKATQSMLEDWAPRVARGTPVDVSKEMMALTLRIVAEALFGIDVSRQTDGIGEAMTVLIEGANRRIMALASILEHLPTRENESFDEARRFLDRIVFSMIVERRRAGADAGDLLSMLLSARDETGAPMSDQQVRDEVLTLLVAGHETTANALAWTLYLLGRHRSAFHRVRDEVGSVLGDRAPEMGDLPKLAYTTRVLEESMRLYPPGWVLARTAVAEDAIAGFTIPAGSVVAVCPYLIHRDPALWKDPDAFDPERFTDEAWTHRPTFAYLPFSAGPRGCIGKGFAMMEMQIVLAMISQRYWLELVPSHRIAPDPQVTLRPKHGVRVYAHAL